MGQQIIVGLIVLSALLYAVLRLSPQAIRESLVATIVSAARKSGMPELRVRKFETKLLTAGGCGSCKTCKQCATPSPGEGNQQTDSAQWKSIQITKRAASSPDRAD